MNGWMPELSTQHNALCNRWAKYAPSQSLMVHIGQVYAFQSDAGSTAYATDSLRCFFALHKFLSDAGDYYYSPPPTCGCKRLRGDCGAMTQSKRMWF